MENPTNNIPSTFPEELNDWEIEAIARALRIDVTAAREKWLAMIGEINRAAVRRSYDTKEREAFEAWADRELPITADRQLARIGWMARAKIAREYEARVEAEIAERTANTSAEMDRLTAQLGREREEVERLTRVIGEASETLREVIEDASKHERERAATIRKLEAELQLLRMQLDVLQPPGTGLRADTPEPEKVAEARRLFDLVSQGWPHQHHPVSVRLMPAGIGQSYADLANDYAAMGVAVYTAGADVGGKLSVDGVMPTAGDHVHEPVTAGLVDVSEAADAFGIVLPCTGKAVHATPTTYRPDRVLVVLADVAHERRNQYAKWGDQVWPMTPSRHPELTPARAQLERQELTWVSAEIMKERCDHAFRNGVGTFAHILCEEVAEALDAPNLIEMRAELIQVAAVAVQMVEVIDAGRNGTPEPEARTDG